MKLLQGQTSSLTAWFHLSQRFVVVIVVVVIVVVVVVVVVVVIVVVVVVEGLQN